jgi:hypothetical protein
VRFLACVGTGHLSHLERSPSFAMERYHQGTARQKKTYQLLNMRRAEKGKGKDYGGVTVEDDEEEEQETQDMNVGNDEDDFDVDNMDFDLPAELLPSGSSSFLPSSSSSSSSSYEPLLMTKEEAAEYLLQSQVQLQSQSHHVSNTNTTSRTFPTQSHSFKQQPSSSLFSLSDSSHDKEKTKTWTVIYPIYL